LVFILCLLILRAPHFLSDSDTGWHIRTGDFIRQTATIPHQDVFSYTMTGRDWFAWEWLTDVLMSIVHGRDGLVGVTKASVMLLFFSYALLLGSMVAAGSDVLLASALTVFAAWVSMFHWLARPHLVSILLIACWCLVIETWRRYRFSADWRRRLIWG